jgi:hypothetical protein
MGVSVGVAVGGAGVSVSVGVAVGGLSVGVAVGGMGVSVGTGLSVGTNVGVRLGAGVKVEEAVGSGVWVGRITGVHVDVAVPFPGAVVGNSRVGRAVGSAGQNGPQPARTSSARSTPERIRSLRLGLMSTFLILREQSRYRRTRTTGCSSGIVVGHGLNPGVLCPGVYETTTLDTVIILTGPGAVNSSADFGRL